MKPDSLENPPAFPACNEANVNGTMGMTLRDWFAGQALAPTLTAMANGQHSVQPGKTVFESAAIDSYAVADTMLRARQQGVDRG